MKLAPLTLDTQAFQDLLIEDEDRTLAQLLALAPFICTDAPLDAKALKTPLGRLPIAVVEPASLGLIPPTAPPASAQAVAPGAPAQAPAETRADPDPAPTPSQHPKALTESQAVAIAYRAEVDKLASFLRARLSVLVACEKLVVPHLWPRIVADLFVPADDGSPREVKLSPRLLELPAEAEPAGPMGGGPSRLDQLRALIRELKKDEVLVIPNLDLIGGGGEKGLNRESRALAEAIYGALDSLVLAFADPSLPLPEVIASRFAVRAEVEGLPPAVQGPDGGPIPIGRALVTAAEAAMFAGLVPEELYKNIAGLNPVRLRQAMSYATQVARDLGHGPDRPARLDLLIDSLRAFKAQSALQFTVPDIGFEHIGGYAEVKSVLERAILLMSGGGRLPEALRQQGLPSELIPRGFLFYGPPGTGKTLFAKAIANRLHATIRVVSGPEVTDMYVGESERKVRAIFAEARRNAPSVIVFDEIDSIAASRSGRDDGGSRAGNALVAQILTEMDGFRPDVPMLVIGTTNRLELIDQALLRPSRFQPVAIGLPDLAARRRIAAIHADHFQVPVTGELLDVIANGTEGLNGDEIRSLFRDACVGHWFEDPPQPMDPWQLGYLVGRIRTRLDTQRAQAQTPRPPPRRGERRGPSGGMVPYQPAQARPLGADAVATGPLPGPPSDPAARG